MFRNGLEPWHIVLVVLVFVLLFGSRKLPDAARGIGKSLRILKSETRALRDDDKPADAPADSTGGAEGAARDAQSQEALEHKPAAQPSPDPNRTPEDRRHTA
ncbi:Sec-independent protein translocase subunit TatA [Streptomyces silvisoli]|uniref:Sec-independent protein translocase protein TatA n=1 Tax=Streptomyces silvisoli TaxID=3034235 RepID=A0ABT5ZRL6_9ACTN|nr:Sec-independent protein translocase subunit TatA [Streptomyces silvisoli]MDF3292194.1 Sec-independent protein translocase subunit TatA [Streptomyces silvisoli]